MFLSDNSVNKTWSVLLGASSGLFFVVGIIMIIADTRYIDGLQHLATAVLCGYGLYRLKKEKLDMTRLPRSQRMMFSLGFLLAVIGMGFNMGIWVFGYILLLGGTLSHNSEKKITKRIRGLFIRKK